MLQLDFSYGSSKNLYTSCLVKVVKLDLKFRNPLKKYDLKLVEGTIKIFIDLHKKGLSR